MNELDALNLLRIADRDEAAIKLAYKTAREALQAELLTTAANSPERAAVMSRAAQLVEARKTLLPGTSFTTFGGSRSAQMAAAPEAETTETDPAAGATRPAERNEPSPRPKSEVRFGGSLSEGLADAAGSAHGMSQTQFADRATVDDYSAGDATTTALKRGSVLCDRYEILDEIGVGGMGVVYSAKDRNRGEEIAIKVLLPTFAQDDEARERFVNEAKISSQLSHPNIVNVYDVQKENDLYFITMELLPGKTLRQEFKWRAENNKTFSVEEVVHIAQSLITALEYAHSITVHRDIKPENIWLMPDFSVKLMDFGIARLLRATQFTQTAAVMGTMQYMAPEQMKQAHEVDGRADQYALAVVMYELLTMTPPAGMFRPLAEQNKDVPAGLSRAVTRALEQDAANRFQSLGEFRTAIETKPVFIDRFRQHKTAASWAAGAVVVLLAVTAVPDGSIGQFLKGMMRDPKVVADVEEHQQKFADLEIRWNKSAEFALTRHKKAAQQAIHTAMEASKQFDAREDDEAKRQYQVALREFTNAIEALEDHILKQAVSAKGQAETLRKKITQLDESLVDEVRDADGDLKRSADRIRSARDENEMIGRIEQHAAMSAAASVARQKQKIAAKLFLSSSVLADLAGRIELGNTTLREENYGDALEAFVSARKDLESLDQQADALEELSTAMRPVEEKIATIDAYIDFADIKLPRASERRRQRLQQAKDKALEYAEGGNFDEAIRGYEAINPGYDGLVADLEQALSRRQIDQLATDIASRARLEAGETKSLRQRQAAEQRRREERDAERRRQEELAAQAEEQRYQEQLAMQQERDRKERERWEQEQARMEQMRREQAARAEADRRYQQAYAEFQACQQNEQIRRQQAAAQAAQARQQAEQICAQGGGFGCLLGAGVSGLAQSQAYAASRCRPPTR